MKRVLHVGLVTCLWLLAGSSRAEDGDDRTLSPFFSVEGAADGVEPFALEATHVSAHINGVIADVTVSQRYRNGGTVPLHARYIFPASTRAAVHGLILRVGDKRVRAQIRERAEAKQAFEAAARSGKTASLLEQTRPNMFSMAVANILPGDQVEVELRYSELLVPTDGVYELVYPTVVGPRYAGVGAAVSGPHLAQGDSPDSAFGMDVSLSTGVPLQEVRSTTHALRTVSRDATSAHLTLDQDGHYAGNRDFILQYTLRGSQLQSGLMLYEGERENHFLLMLQPPARTADADITAREYVFVLDVSGSMQGFPLNTAKTLLENLVSALRPTDTFNVLLFSGDSRLMAERSVPATRAHIDEALTLISGQTGGGGTELEAALARVNALPRSSDVSRSVIVLSDGYISQERGTFTQITDHLQTTNVFAFGIGSSVNRYLIEGLARAGRGEPFIVTKPSEAASVAERFRRYIQSPLLRDVHVQFRGFDAYDVEPSVQPDLFAERPIVIFGKWRGPRTGSVEVSARAARGPFHSSLAIAQAKSSQEHDALTQLWARSRIARLSDIAQDENENREQITRLGLQYSLLTAHTSFIAVLEQIRNPGGVAADAGVPQPLPMGVSEMAEAYESGAEPELLLLLMAAVGVLAFTHLRRRAAGQAS